MKSQITLTGNLHVEVYDQGHLAYEERVQNLVPQTGRNVVRQLLLRPQPQSTTGFAPTHIAVGTDNTAPHDTDTTLGAELAGGRFVILNRYAKSNASSYQIFIDTDELNGNTLREGGLFDNPTIDSGNLIAHSTFTPIAKTISIQVVLTWDLNIASS